MITRFSVLRSRLQAEWHNIHSAAKKAEAAFDASHAYRMDAAALNLYSFYNGLERLFESVARQVDGTVPAGSAWHRELLEQMALDLTDVRPPVLSRESLALLRDYLGFRHVVRDLYTWELDSQKVAELVDKLPTIVAALEADLVQCGRFLDAAAHADEK